MYTVSPSLKIRRGNLAESNRIEPTSLDALRPALQTLGFQELAGELWGHDGAVHNGECFQRAIRHWQRQREVEVLASLALPLGPLPTVAAFL